MIVFPCPACGHSVTIMDESSVDETTCKKCGKDLRVPDVDDPGAETYPEFPALNPTDAPADFPSGE